MMHARFGAVDHHRHLAELALCGWFGGCGGCGGGGAGRIGFAAAVRVAARHRRRWIAGREGLLRLLVIPFWRVLLGMPLKRILEGLAEDALDIAKRDAILRAPGSGQARLDRAKASSSSSLNSGSGVA